MIIQSFNDIDTLYANLMRDMGENAKSIFTLAYHRLEAFIWGRGTIENSAPAEPGFYSKDHFEKSLAELTKKIQNREDDSKVSQVLDADYLLGDPIFSNFSKFSDPKEIYDKIQKKSVYGGGVGEISFILKSKNSDLDKVPPGRPDQASYEWLLSDEVLGDPTIVDADDSSRSVVRAALVYEREDLGHTPWKKLHMAADNVKFIASLVSAPEDLVHKTESTEE